MRSAAIIRFVTWAIIAVFLIFILISSVVTDGFPGFFSFDIYDILDVARDTPKTIFEGSAGSINIDFADAKLNIKEGSELKVTEYTDGKNSHVKAAKNGDTLMVSSDKRVSRFLSFGWFSQHVSVDITVPKDQLQDLKARIASGDVIISNVESKSAVIDTTSASIKVNNINSGDLKIDTTSGDVSGSGIKADSAYYHTVSGDINIKGDMKEIKADGVSSDFDILSSSMPQKTDLSDISGDVKLYLPENDGFDLRYSTVSGDFDSDFALTRTGGDKKGNCVYKNGGSVITVKTTSGDININK
ncbi:MAG: DUF4097 family beta strand repeat-containing protein [Bacillota bacterium]|nr:DUF4097 family beta strand repeat-containing protein [Bacillota bacterium]